MPANFFEKFPSVSELLDSPALKPWVDRASRNAVVTSVKSFVGRMSNDLQTRAAEMKVPSVSELAERIAEWIAKQRASGPQAEINATGILLPQNCTLPLAEEALHSMHVTLRDYVGKRNHSGRQVADLLRQLTGVDGALVCGTHSGALLLTLAATCVEKPAVIARGQVGEIEPGVPLPQIAKSAGVLLKECGTVERTSTEDYRDAMNGAGALLSVASTRYAITGSESHCTDAELAAIAHRHHVPWVADLGLGGLIDAARYGLAGIPQASAVIAVGADLAILAGDQLIGGPACGIVVGREAAIEKLRRHPLYASLAATPIVLAPLAATLELYQDTEVAERSIPLLTLLANSIENLENRAKRLAPQLAASALVAGADVQVGTATLLGRELPGQTLPTAKIIVRPQGISAQVLADKLAALPSPIIGQIQGDTLVIDLRTVFPRQDLQLADGFESLSKKNPPPVEDVPQDQAN